MFSVPFILYSFPSYLHEYTKHFPRTGLAIRAMTAFEPFRAALLPCFDFVYLIIKRPFIHQVVSFLLLLCALQQLSSINYFQVRMNQLLLAFLFILTPDKTHRLWGNWSWGSCFVLAVLSGMAINQVIYCVREGPFLYWIHDLRQKKKKKADATEVLKVCEGTLYFNMTSPHLQTRGRAS